MPKLKPSNAVNILKPDKLRLGYGETGTCTVTGPHVTGGKDELDSLPVQITIPAGTAPDGATRPASTMEGNFPLNATRKNLLMGLWGDDTDYWEKGSYQWVVVPQNNPQTKQQVPAWLINASSVQPKGIRPKDQTPIQA